MALALLALLSCAGAHAEIRGISYSLWSIAGRNVTLRYTLPMAEARPLVPPGWPPASTERVGEYLLRHVAVSAGGVACAAIDQGYDIGRVDPLSLAPGLYGFEIMFRCDAAGPLTLQNSALFEFDPHHLDLARIRLGNAPPALQLFTATHTQAWVRERAIPSGPGAYLPLGMSHELHSFDNLCFLLALPWLACGARRLGRALAALALGYAMALALCLSGLLLPHAAELEAGIGVTLVLTAAQLVAQASRRGLAVALGCGALLWLAALLLALHGASAWLLGGAGLFAVAYLLMCARADALPTLWLLPSLLFGFLDGFTLPADFARVGLWARVPPWGTAAFDVGALLLATIVFATWLGSAALLRGRKWERAAPLARDLVGTALAGLGSFWLLSRFAA
jgi:hypothetical protein